MPPQAQRSDVRSHGFVLPKDCSWENVFDVITCKMGLKSVNDAFWRFAYRIAFCGYCTMNFFRRPTTRGAAVAVWHNGCVLVVRNSYRKGLNLPGGMVRHGEELVSAAARELEEELGICTDEAQLEFAFEAFSFFEFRHDHTYIFELTVSEAPEINYNGRSRLGRLPFAKARLLFDADSTTSEIFRLKVRGRAVGDAQFALF